MTFDARIYRRAAFGCLVSLVTLLSSACPETEGEGGTGQGDRDAAAIGDSGSGGGGGGDGGGDGGGAGVVSCGYWATVRSGCSGDSSFRKTAYGRSCSEGVDLATCRANVPPDTDEETGSCFRSESFDYWMFEGDCDDWDAYWNDEVDCLIDDQCGAGNACLGQTCYCGDEPCVGSFSAPTTGDAGSDGGAGPEGGVVSVGGDGGTTDPSDGGAMGPGDGGTTDPSDGGGSTNPDAAVTTPEGGAGTGEPDGGVTTPGGGFTTP